MVTCSYNTTRIHSQSGALRNQPFPHSIMLIYNIQSSLLQAHRTYHKVGQTRSELKLSRSFKILLSRLCRVPLQCRAESVSQTCTASYAEQADSVLTVSLFQNIVRCLCTQLRELPRFRHRTSLILLLHSEMDIRVDTNSPNLKFLVMFLAISRMPLGSYI